MVKTTNDDTPHRSGEATGARSGGPNALVRYLISQFHRPRGPFGTLVGRIMSSRGSNVDRNLLLVDMLDLEPGHRVLEIGPGPGVALAEAARRVTTGHLVAVDHSQLMLRQTADRNRDGLRDGRLTLIHRAVDELPGDLVDFDRIWAMNCWHFWSYQEATVADLARRLRPGGMLLIGHQPRGGATGTDAARRCLRDQFADAGLTGIDDRIATDLDPPVAYVRGRR